jgi:hypothetical protein
LRIRYVLPLLGFVIPTVIIGYGFVIPRSCIAGWTLETIGFTSTVIGACVTYFAGFATVLRDARLGKLAPT